MINATEVRRLLELVTEGTGALQTAINEQVTEREGSLMTQAQMSEMILRIGELTVVTAGLAAGELAGLLERLES